MPKIVWLVLTVWIRGALPMIGQRTMNSLEPRGTHVQFFQDGEEIRWFDEEWVINMKRESFEMRFNLRKYTEQDPSALRVMFTSTPPDVNVLNTDGAGLAGRIDSLYEDAIIDPGGFHYIYYQNELERRANLLVEKGGNVYLSWPIEAWYNYQERKPLRDFKGEALFVSCYSDWNNNQMIDEAELVVFTIHFTH